MKSPFPGMDPYLERHWGDVHSSIVTVAKQVLQPQLGNDLVARSEERIYLDDDDAIRCEAGLQDVAFEVASDETTESFIQILDTRNGNRVVTVIEFVSPSNKLYKAARESYKKKQEECLDTRANLVEVDLTRAGKRDMLVRDFDLPDSKRGEYLVSVYRANIGKYGRREGYGLKLRERLPGIRIPLRAGDPDVVLDLQALIDQAYEAGAYGRTLDYNMGCEPALPPEHSQWADELLRAAGRRK